MNLLMTDLGKYVLHEQMGSGGFGHVYRATDTLGRTVAIKVLKPGWSDDPATIQRFQQEARAAGELFHPRIASILDFDQADGRLYLVMRYVDGLSLDRLLKEHGRLSWEETLRLVTEISEGLDYAHQRGFVHRDIKPANILISPEEGAVITDFGLVKALQSSGLSTSGVLMGTPHYMAPEIWQGQPVTPATDVYALACVCYEMLTGQVLFAGDSPPEVMTRHILHGPEFPTAWPPGTPAGIQAVLQRALARRPEERFGRAGELVQAFHQLEQVEIIALNPNGESPLISQVSAEAPFEHTRLAQTDLPTSVHPPIGAMPLGPVPKRPTKARSVEFRQGNIPSKSYWGAGFLVFVGSIFIIASLEYMQLGLYLVAGATISLGFVSRLPQLGVKGTFLIWGIYCLAYILGPYPLLVVMLLVGCTVRHFLHTFTWKRILTMTALYDIFLVALYLNDEPIILVPSSMFVLAILFIGLWTWLLFYYIDKSEQAEQGYV